jgi:hypothetical protein
MKRIRWPQAAIPTESEYRANLTGMNTFFGAVLGFVISDVKASTDLAFAAFLVFTAGVVIGILYISASKYRFLYSALTLWLVYELPRVFDGQIEVPPRLQIALAVWTILTIALEYLPRQRDPTTASPTEPA